MADNHLKNIPSSTISQGTQDASKWNECLAPSAFALMHRFFFNDSVRNKLGLKKATEMGKLFSRITVTGNFLMACKQVQLGPGVHIVNEDFYSRLEWCVARKNMMNTTTLKWFKEVEHLLIINF